MINKLLLLVFSIILIGSVSAFNWNDGNLIFYHNCTSAVAVSGGSNFDLIVGSSDPIFTDNTQGIIGNGCSFDGDDHFYMSEQNQLHLNHSGITSNQSTISFWIKSNQTTPNAGLMGKETGASTGTFQFLYVSNKYAGNFLAGAAGGWMYSNAVGTNQVWEHIVYQANATTVSMWRDGVLQDAQQAIGVTDTTTSTWKIGNRGQADSPLVATMDEISVWNRSLSATEIAEIYNGGIGLGYTELGASVSFLEINLDIPTNNSKISGNSIIFNSTITPTLFNITNATIFIWNSTDRDTTNFFNRTTNLLTGNETNTTSWNISSFELGNDYYWNVYGCGDNETNVGVCIWSTNNFTFTSSAFVENSFKFNNSALETSTQLYSINITGNELISSATAQLWYNGTRYTSIVSNGIAGKYKASNAIDTQISNFNSANKSFWWEWTFTLTSGSIIKQNTTIKQQEVNKTYLVNCNTTFADQFINFTTHSSMNPFPDLNATFKTAWEWWLGSGTVTRNYSYEDISEANYTFDFCMSPADKDYNVNAQVEFDATGYSQNYHYLTEAELSNTTSHIDLYLLNDSLATVTILQVYDTAQVPINDVTIQIQLYDIGTDTFYTVGISKTGHDGKDIAYLNWYDSLYKFILTKDGEVLTSTSPYKISESPQIFQISGETVFTYDKFNDFVYSLIFNNATNNFVLTYVKPSGLVNEACLRVIKRNPTNDTQICLTCESSSSATVYCNIAGYGNGTYIASFYATGSLKIIDTISTFVGVVNEIFDQIGNLDGSAYAFLFAGVVVGMFFISPIFAIVGLLLAITGAFLLGFQPINYIQFIGIIILGGVVLWILKR